MMSTHFDLWIDPNLSWSLLNKKKNFTWTQFHALLHITAVAKQRRKKNKLNPSLVETKNRVMQAVIHAKIEETIQDMIT